MPIQPSHHVSSLAFRISSLFRISSFGFRISPTPSGCIMRNKPNSRTASLSPAPPYRYYAKRTQSPYPPPSSRPCHSRHNGIPRTKICKTNPIPPGQLPKANSQHPTNAKRTQSNNSNRPNPLPLKHLW